MKKILVANRGEIVFILVMVFYLRMLVFPRRLRQQE